LNTATAPICKNKNGNMSQARSHGEAFQGSVPPNFLVPRKNCFKNIIKTKLVPIYNCILPLQTPKPGYGPDMSDTSNYRPAACGGR